MNAIDTITDSRGVEYIRLDNDTCYYVNTPQRVIDVLETARHNHDRIRLFLGDSETGRDWCEEYDTMGYVGRSTGSIKIPLLINNERSTGGGAILTDSIVKITYKGITLYQHSKYHIGKLTYEKSGIDSLPHGVFKDGENIVNFGTKEQALRYMDFLWGNRNSK